MVNALKIKGFTDVLRKTVWLSVICLIVVGGTVYYSKLSQQIQETVILEAKKPRPVIFTNPIVFERKLTTINREIELLGDLLAQTDFELRNRNRESALQTLTKVKSNAIANSSEKLPQSKVEKKTSIISKIDQIERDIRHEKIKEASQELHILLDQIDADY